MINFWISKIECTSCGACQTICPQSAIQMEPDECGFTYPSISLNCVECGLCVKVCPIKNEYAAKKESFGIYAAWSKDFDTRYHSTSGGIFSELAYDILRNDGIISGASYDSDNRIQHVLAVNKAELKKIRQSKYAQSEIGVIFKEIKIELNQRKQVLFCGTPCQVAGLYSYLGKEYEKLVTVDFICRGVNSPKAYQAWLKQREEVYHSKAVKVWFKYKEFGWHNSPFCTRVDFKNGQVYVAKGDNNTFMRGYLGPNLYIRPCCGNCHFKGMERQGDITLADFWGIEKEWDDDLGTSLVLLNSNKGKQIFESITEHIECSSQDINKISDKNICMNQSVNINPKSAEFLRKLSYVPFDDMIAKYTKLTLYQKIVNFIKKQINKMRTFIRLLK